MKVCRFVRCDMSWGWRCQWRKQRGQEMSTSVFCICTFEGSFVLSENLEAIIVCGIVQQYPRMIPCTQFSGYVCQLQVQLASLDQLVPDVPRKPGTSGGLFQKLLQVTAKRKLHFRGSHLVLLLKFKWGLITLERIPQHDEISTSNIMLSSFYCRKLKVHRL